ncbi:carbohydrate ABC transporter permease [Vallitalea pronyensis]|uniref:Carbohydrate ABC transporter permease n=1 Tax=Vallitalea pronyensis TaxID=1348613 RepID=A0A8J8MPS4_9FIRM|nr:carbohydrate ABC transporter permease [Vallitalea pronyensis]QUI25486.1 carbohydrate ABC transporter permease [Vallitalea pronyensis]
MGKLHELRRKIILYTLLCISSISMVLPFLWMLSASLKSEKDVFSFPIQWITDAPVWRNYIVIWEKIDFATYYMNTIKLTVVITILQLITCSLAAYAFAKIDFPEQKVLFLGYLATMMVPFQVVMIPQFIIMKNLHLTDTHMALILLQAFSPFGVFLLRQYYLNIPNELLEAARIDGMGEFKIYSKIMVPLAKPALASLSIFTFVFVWNDFLGPLIYLNTDKNKTIQLGIRKFITEYTSEYSLIMAASVCALIPVLIIFLLAQKYFIEGVAMTGMKG